MKNLAKELITATYEKDFKNIDFFKFEVIQYENDYCTITVFEDKTFLIFAGSNDIPDWLDNIKLYQFSFSGIKTIKGKHAGFDEPASKLQKGIDEFLSKHHGPNKPLFVEGHSRGGALAICYLDNSPYFYQTYLTTYGAPRAVKRTAKKRLSKRPLLHITQYKYGFDFVTNYPLSLFGWRHLVKLTKIKRKLFFGTRYTDHLWKNYK